MVKLPLTITPLVNHFPSACKVGLLSRPPAGRESSVCVAFGWLSIALVIFALWRPHMTIIGSTVFGFLFSCSSYIANIDFITVTMATKPLLKMLPYVVTILVLIITSIRNKRENQPPASLGMAYFREER